MQVTVHERRFKLRRPLLTAGGELRERTILELSITGADGVTGRGEAAALEHYDGVPLAMVRAALEAYAPVLEGAGESSGATILDTCREVADLPQALAAVDLALWDRAGRREGKPVCRLLAADPLEAVVVNAVIGAVDPVTAADDAAEAVRCGARCLKVKVAAGDDGRRVAAVRAVAGPRVLLRLDANGGWTVEQAVAAIGKLAPAGLELVEEPVHGVEALRAVRDRTAVRIAMDETGAEPGAIGSGAADAVCLKISRAGGISGLLAQAALVRAAGADVYLASTFDGPLGIAAALHCAAALRCELPCGLATLSWFEDEPDELPVRDGVMAVPAAPGLGVG